MTKREIGKRLPRDSLVIYGKGAWTLIGVTKPQGSCTQWYRLLYGKLGHASRPMLSYRSRRDTIRKHWSRRDRGQLKTWVEKKISFLSKVIDPIVDSDPIINIFTLNLFFTKPLALKAINHLF